MDDYEVYEDELPEEGTARPPDPVEGKAVEAVRSFFDRNRDRVFSSRQVEVAFERTYFHWVTHRAINLLVEERSIGREQRKLASGAPVNFLWHRSNRYTRRQMREVQSLIERYSDSSFTAALGQTGELLVSDGLGRFRFVQHGRDVREYNGRRWTKTKHNLDFVFARDERVYGVEVKNTLPYIHDSELAVQLEMCAYFGIVPLFVVRMMPRIWVRQVVQRGGFVLILEHHLYPLSHKALAAEVRETRGLPADAPRALYDGTIQRFVNWHERQIRTRVPAPVPQPATPAQRSGRGPIAQTGE